GRERELVDRPLEAELRQREAQRGVGLVEDGPGSRPLVEERAAHAHPLRALARKEERQPGHRYHLTAADAQARPPPSAENSNRSPSLILPSSTASSSAVG